MEPAGEDDQLTINRAFAHMLKGGVIMDVMTVEQAKIAEAAGAVAVMALERIPADIRAYGGVSRMSDPAMIQRIKNSISIPVMAKCRIGHFVEAEILQASDVDFVDESEVLTIADTAFHIDKKNFKVPFVCGCRNLGEALRRISEGAAMIRTKGEAGTGDIQQAVKHLRTLFKEIEELQQADPDLAAAQMRVPVDIVKFVQTNKKLPVVNFAAGGVSTPADAALCMKLGAEGVFVGSGIFKASDPAKMASAIVQAVTHYSDPFILSNVSKDLGIPMFGIPESSLKQKWAEVEAVPDDQ